MLTWPTRCRRTSRAILVIDGRCCSCFECWNQTGDGIGDGSDSSYPNRCWRTCWRMLRRRWGRWFRSTLTSARICIYVGSDQMPSREESIRCRTCDRSNGRKSDQVEPIALSKRWKGLVEVTWRPEDKYSTSSAIQWFEITLTYQHALFRKIRTSRRECSNTERNTRRAELCELMVCLTPDDLVGHGTAQSTSMKKPWFLFRHHFDLTEDIFAPLVVVIFTVSRTPVFARRNRLWAVADALVEQVHRGSLAFCSVAGWCSCE